MKALLFLALLITVACEPITITPDQHLKSELLEDSTNLEFTVTFPDFSDTIIYIGLQ